MQKETGNIFQQHISCQSFSIILSLSLLWTFLQGTIIKKKKTNSERDQNNYKPSLRKQQLSSKALILKHDEYITDATDLLNEINLTKYCKGVKYSAI